MTLDEWKRAQARQQDKPQFNVRKPQGPKGLKVLPSKFDEAGEHDDEHDIIVEKRPSKKHVIALDFKSAAGSRSQGDRGGRGGRGGGGDRGGGRVCIIQSRSLQAAAWAVGVAVAAATARRSSRRPSSSTTAAR